MGPTIGQRGELIKESSEDSFNILADVLVRKSKRRVASMPVDLVATRITTLVVSVSIDLNNQAFLRTEKIDDAIADHVLAPKLVAAELRSADVTPELSLEWGPIPAETPSALE